jgi:hypothetical protein
MTVDSLRRAANALAGQAMDLFRWWRDAPDGLAWLVLAAVTANIASYVVFYADPIIISDAWYFLDVFVSKALRGTLGLSDFFVQRGGLDHAQPFRKLILLAETRYFDMDFRIEALAGLVGAVVCALLLRKLMFWHVGANRAGRSWLWAASAVALMSLNSPGVWSWPLVASGLTSYAFLFGMLVALWRSISSGRTGWLVLTALVLDMAADDTAMLATVACLATLALAAWHAPEWRGRIARAAAVLVACLVLSRITYALIYTPPRGIVVPFGVRLDKLLTAFADGGWWKWPLVPLGSSVVYSRPASLLLRSWPHAQIAVGLFLLAAHVWFWWRAFRTRPNAAMFVAIALMLVFYALLAGIVYGRVSSFGNNYLNQPRYVLPYSFNLIALLLMAAGSLPEQTPAGNGKRLLVAALSSLFILWQVPLSRIAWRDAPYQAIYQQKLAQQIWYMGEHPAAAPDKCLPLLVVCGWSPQKRAELVGLLKQYRLNVFSPRFQRATRLVPPDEPPAR